MDLNLGLLNLRACSFHFSAYLTTPGPPNLFHFMFYLESVSVGFHSIVGEMAEEIIFVAMVWEFVYLPSPILLHPPPILPQFMY